MKVFWIRDAHKRPLACVASELVDGQYKWVRFAVSVHNPMDAFDRSRGREIAVARLHRGKHSLELMLLEGMKPKVEIMTRVAETTSLPARVRQAAQLWLEVHAK